MQATPSPSFPEGGWEPGKKPDELEADEMLDHMAEVKDERLLADEDQLTPVNGSLQDEMVQTSLVHALGEHQKQLRYLVDKWIQEMQGMIEADPQELQAKNWSVAPSVEVDFSSTPASPEPSPPAPPSRFTYGPVTDDKDLGQRFTVAGSACLSPTNRRRQSSLMTAGLAELKSFNRQISGEEKTESPGLQDKEHDRSARISTCTEDLADVRPYKNWENTASGVSGYTEDEVVPQRTRLSNEAEVIDLSNRDDEQDGTESQGTALSFQNFADIHADDFAGLSRGKSSRTSIGKNNSSRHSGVLGSSSLIHHHSTILGIRRRRTHGLAEILGYRHLYVVNCTCSVFLSKVVTSHQFETVCAAVIFSNAVMMGISADYEMEHLNGPPSNVLKHLEFAFCIFYTIEVSLRISVWGRTFFTGQDWKWNWFDSILIIMAISDQVQEFVTAEKGQNSSGTAAGNLSFLRMLRLFKMLKLLRMIRLMKMFRELRLILYSMLGSMQAMLWASLLVLIISYMVGICFTFGCTSYLQDVGEDVPAQTHDMIQEHWSSVGRSMLSLFKATTAGMEWTKLSEPLLASGYMFYSLFIIYVAFFLFVVMNTLTSLFVDAVMEHSSKDQQMIIQMELEKKDQYIVKLQAFFDEIDEDGDGVVSLPEFLEHADNPVLHAFAASLDIDITNAKQFFHILFNEGTLPVNIETFVVGCIKLRGQARSMDLMDLIHTTKNMHVDFAKSWGNVMIKLAKIEKALNLKPSLFKRSGTTDRLALPGLACSGRQNGSSVASESRMSSIEDEGSASDEVSGGHQRGGRTSISM